MIKDEIRDILKSLLERTEAKQVTWSASELHDFDDYVVSFPNSSVNIIRDDDSLIRANILNSNGRYVAGISSLESNADASLLENLLYSARASANRFDETIEDLKRALAS